MHYLSKSDLLQLGVKWDEMIEKIRETVYTLKDGDFAQPIKPYLRYRDLTNRIIAMPAFVGGKVSFSGIKWIASFPENIKKNIPRANSVTILNEADTGIPACIINTSHVSAVRTAAVTGLVVKEYLQRNQQKKLSVGIIGFGPIGQQHLDMVSTLLGDRLDYVNIYDLNPPDSALVPAHLKEKVNIVKTWEEAFGNADILMTCTVSKKPYINKVPKKGSLQLNISLRDYVPEFINYTNHIVVDDWEEVCRENTDIEVMHKTQGLTKEGTLSLVDIICEEKLRHAGTEEVVMFNPMGMAVFDIATAVYFYEKAKADGVGTVLAD
ncbi:2,3-diaminopropionate biosynthesis protein SbnB [Chitinophaga oryzae]|uniref:2,3-diaminopropionate biosynthesis protein SbnB n=1 Tax=Chitinophaga oryzae TaxID=2725414 RepID=A0AAE6ZG31_9BACT|nr:2,3-diaminopropionate biosynthesis protein SbnB [Chitinophaga oryzae]QJB31971.1 2,3-diaminopropionate biosynthesis protein SbnB [Chitinophaga oryzae]